MHIHSEQAIIARAWIVCLGQMVVTLLEVREKEKGVVAKHLPIGSSIHIKYKYSPTSEQISTAKVV